MKVVSIIKKNLIFHVFRFQEDKRRRIYGWIFPYCGIKEWTVITKPLELSDDYLVIPFEEIKEFDGNYCLNCFRSQDMFEYLCSINGHVTFGVPVYCYRCKKNLNP